MTEDRKLPPEKAFAAIHEALDNPALDSRGLLEITEEAKYLLYNCLYHAKVDVEECRSLMGQVSDAVWDEIDEELDPRPAFHSRG